MVERKELQGYNALDVVDTFARLHMKQLTSMHVKRPSLPIPRVPTRRALFAVLRTSCNFAVLRTCNTARATWRHTS